MGIVVEWSAQRVRVLALIHHFLFTTFLIWTRIDQIQIANKYSSDAYYSYANYSYQRYIGFGILFLIVQFVILGVDGANINLGTILHIFLDIVGSFFVIWITLDGLSWITYTYIFYFCVAIPTFYDLCRGAQYLLRLQRTSSSFSRPGFFTRQLYYLYGYRQQEQ